MTKNINIHETAFMTSMFRSMNEDLSKDGYSKLWNTTKTKLWVDDYLQYVSGEEVNTHCIRNRFFLDTLKKLRDQNAIDIVINFGSGFSMYPFLLDESLEHIEIDKPEIIAYKQKQIGAWISSGKLPRRKINFLGVDFSQEYSKKLFEDIKRIKQDRNSLILIEGVVFFLKEAETNSLFDFFEKIQQQGDYIGSVSFEHKIKSTLVFDRLIKFFNERLLKTSKEDYLTLDTSFYINRRSYKVSQVEDYFSYSKKVNNKVNLEINNVLNENYYVLQKQ